MNNNRLGCLSPIAIVASTITLLVIAGFAFTSGNSLFTAGELNARAGENIGGVTSHAEIGSDCAKCHAAPWEAATLGDRCQVCHTGITAELNNPASAHGEMMKGQSVTCRTCHPEHRGPTAALTDMQSGNFPHGTTGYSLNSHQRRSDGQAFLCSDCHGDDVSRFDPPACTTCHQQIDQVFMTTHTQAYGTNCRSCHDGVETIGENFDHSQVTFKLEGKHAGPACDKCHLNAQTAADFKSAPSECEACHEKDDAHKGELGKGCGACHKPAAWKPSTFDHNLSAFKLEGEHAEAECGDCHVDNIFKGTPSNCFACHQKDDEHNGKFGQDCATCHNTSDWEEATFDHNRSIFKLDGAHVTVACEKCHTDAVFKGTPIACFACHQKDDQHKGKFGETCSACHSTDGWKPATFDHNLSAFKLTGGHANVACEKCHIDNVFENTSTECAVCHGNPAFHSGMFIGTACSSCHNTGSWIPARYDGRHPGIADDGGSGIRHGGEGCRSCHTVNLSTATCTQCHKNNKPDDGD